MSGDSREGSPDWLRSFKAPAAPCSLLSLSSESDSSPINSPIREKDAILPGGEPIGKSLWSGPGDDAILIDSGDDRPEHLVKEEEKAKSPKKTGKQALPKKTGKQATPKKTRKQAKDHDMEEEIRDVNAAAEEDGPEKPVVSHVSSRLPLVLPDKVQRSKALVECDGDSIDLSGDVGAVGRIVISNTASGNHEMLLDLKGTVYQSTIVPSRTFCVVSFGQTEAKIEAIMNDFVQLKPHSNVFEAETIIEGTLDGFSFGMEDEGDRIHKSAANKGVQDSKNGDHADELSNGKAEKSLGVKRKRATIAANPPKKVARKTQVSRKAKVSKRSFACEGGRLAEPVQVRTKKHRDSTHSDSDGYPSALNGYVVEHRSLCHSLRGVYQGATGKASVHALPEVKTQQNSLSAIQLINDESDGSPGPVLNMIQAGWQVNPDLYGDTQTRFFTHWTVDHNQSTGCYNVDCTGFVLQSGSPVVPGSILSPTTMDGFQKYITLTIYKDPATGHWWLVYEDEVLAAVHVGYWPNYLFTGLGSRATLIGYGGFVSFPMVTYGPPMGSGHFSSEGEGIAATFKNIRFLDNNYLPFNYTEVIVLNDASTCYNVSSPFNSDDDDGMHFYFGGPEGCTIQK